MADSDPTEVPPQLRLARRALEEVEGIALITDWAPDPSQRWRLEVDLTPSDLGTTVSIPATTRWFVRVPATYPRGIIDILPAKDGGLLGTFPHQLPSDTSAEAPYRGGKICVATDSEGNLRVAGEAEPKTPGDRLLWHLIRALGWLQSASRGLLLRAGDRFELPVYRGHSAELFVFREGPTDLARWESSTDGEVGLADLRELRTTAGRYWAVAAFRSLNSKVLWAPSWGKRIGSQVAERRTALWLRAPGLPVRPPYAAPATWRELAEFFSEHGADLFACLREGSARLYDRSWHPLLLGFPVPELVGGPAKQMHWLAVDLPVLDHRAPSGFRPNELGLWRANVESTFNPAADINWAATQNWHPEELATRGRLVPNLASGRTLMIGAGALGSAVAELLVRAGVTRLTVLDGEVLVAGNLVRHTLTLEELMEPKALAVAARLNAASPNADVVGIAATAESKVTSRFLQDFDLVVDTTGDHQVLELLAAVKAGSSTTWASLAITLHARHLVAFLARGASLPVGAFDAAYGPFAEAETRRGEELPWEGVGCWHPVFPARADEVWLMASMAVGLLNDAWPLEPDSSDLRVFERVYDDAERFVGVAEAKP